jgi:hypothetical protein
MFRQNNKLIDALYFLKKLMILVKKINIINSIYFLLLFFFVKNIQFFYIINEINVFFVKIHTF